MELVGVGEDVVNTVELARTTCVGVASTVGVRVDDGTRVAVAVFVGVGVAGPTSMKSIASGSTSKTSTERMTMPG